MTKNTARLVFDDGTEKEVVDCERCGHILIVHSKCVGCELKDLKEKVKDAQAALRIAGNALHSH